MSVDAPPRLSEPHRLGNVGFTFELIGVPWRTYVIQASTNLTDWETISTNDRSGDGVRTLNDPGATAFAARFYRA